MNNPTPPPPPPSSTATTVSPTTVKKAVNALFKWRSSKSQTQKPQLLVEDEFIYLNLTLKKIPPKGRTNAHKIPIPHSLHSDSSEFCLIIDDRPKSMVTKDAAMKKIKSENIPISKVIKFSKLKSDYLPFEAKRKLCDSYDMFLADRRVIPLLPRLLGKQIFKKKKIPVPVELRHSNWKEQIEKVCGSVLLYMGTGTCSVLRVGKVSMEKEEIVENVLAAINGVVEIVPQKWRNLRSFHLKLLESLALPVYQAEPEVGLRIEGVSLKEEKVKDAVGIRTEAKKGRIHEVRYMDSNMGESVNGDEFGNDDDGDIVEPGVGKDGAMDSGEFEVRKRKKGGLLKDKKGAKKFATLEKQDRCHTEEVKSWNLKVDRCYTARGTCILSSMVVNLSP